MPGFWLIILLIGTGGLPLSSQEMAEPEDVVKSEMPSLSYEIEVELDDQEKMLYGREKLTWINIYQEPVPDIYFHLYWNAFRNEKSVFFKEMLMGGVFARRDFPDEGEWGWIDITEIKTADGTDLTGAMEFVAPDGPEGRHDMTVMKLTLPRPIVPGELVRLDIKFKNKIPRTVARSGYYRDSFFMAQWYPKPGVFEPGRGWNCHAYHLNSEFYADFADYTVNIRLPEKYVVGATGKEIEVHKETATGMVTRTFFQAMVHDFAWAADPRFIKLERWFKGDEEVTAEEYEQTAALLGLPVSEVKLPDVKMILLLEPEHKRQAERHFKALRAALKYYGLLYGPYPYEKVTMVDPPFRSGSGGMEYPTLFAAGTSVLASDDVLSPEGVIVHEFGHNYWYGLVASNEFEEAWLDEGFNTYSTGKVLAKAYGSGELPIYFRGIPLNGLLNLPEYYDYELDRAVAINVAELDPITAYSWKFSSPLSYSANVYMRATTLLNTLELFLGEPTMAKVMRTYQSKFRYKHPKTRDFIAVANEVSGRDLTWFFNELLMASRNFDYGVWDVSCTEKARYHLGVHDVDGRKEEMTQEKIREILKREDKAAEAGQAGFELPKKEYVTKVVLRRFGEAAMNGDASVEFRVRFEDGSEEYGLWDGRDRWARFEYVRDARVSQVMVDPRGIWLIDSNFTNNSWQKSRINRNMAGLMSRIVFFLQNLFLTAAALI